MNRLHSFLFGAIERIDIHADGTDPMELRQRALDRLGWLPSQVPVAFKPALLGCNYVLVQYGQGLFRSAHADVLVLP